MYNIYDAVELYIELGTPVDKMVLGLPSYGRGHRLYDESQDGLFCETYEPIDMGPITLQDGLLGYNEILELFNNDTYSSLPDATPGKS